MHLLPLRAKGSGWRGEDKTTEEKEKTSPQKLCRSPSPRLSTSPQPIRLHSIPSALVPFLRSDSLPSNPSTSTPFQPPPFVNLFTASPSH